MAKILRISKLKNEKGKGKGKKTINDHAEELSIKAKSIGIQKKAKTHKGRKILENRAPKLQENPKHAIFIKGNKSS
jgi:ribosomal protein L34